MSCQHVEEHEAFCGHHVQKPEYGKPNYRVKFADGCVSTACSDCMLKLPQDVVELAGLDGDGIPVDPRAWTLADTTAHLIRWDGRGV